MVADDANEVSEWWEDKKLLEQVTQTDKDMESGKDGGVAWQEAQMRVLARKNSHPDY